jgi:Flp pilus assembly protein TadG
MHLPVPGHRRDRQATKGQTVVEFALILPVLILLLLITIDFGRAFLGWVSLNNAARVGANYAALHPNDTWGAGTDYQVLMTDNMDAINCEPNPDPAAAPVFGATRDPGDAVRVNLSCDFTIVTPIISSIVGSTVTISASSAFPITEGCLADCPTGPGAPPPPPPDDLCRTVPDVEGMSVAGARLAWEAAGFPADQFDPETGDDTRTVETQSVTEAPNTEGCSGSESYYDSSMTVTLEAIEPVVTGCQTLPNLVGITVGDARDVWTAEGFTGAFLPTDSDNRVVLSQVTDPDASPGDCVPPTTAVIVSHGPGWPAPPPPPCTVPSFVNTSSDLATDTWTGAGFDAANIDFSRGGTFTIRSQSLVGGTKINCTAEILLSHQAGNNP